MKALRLHGVGDLRLADEPDPVPRPAEALVRVTAVGICGSDLHWYDESGIGDAVLTRTLILGHRDGRPGHLGALAALGRPRGHDRRLRRDGRRRPAGRARADVLG